MYRVFVFIVLLFFCSSCAALNLSNDTSSVLRGISPAIVYRNSSIDRSGEPSSIDRSFSLAALDNEYNAVKDDLQQAMMYATFRQRKDYYKRKNIGLLGVLFGVTATTLNAASSANIVASTALTGAQTAITGYIATDDNLTDPYSNIVITKTKNELEELHSKYFDILSELRDSNIGDSEWAKKYGSAVATLRSINFKCFSILPPQ